MNLKNKLKQQALKTLSTNNIQQSTALTTQKRDINSIEQITLTIKTHLQELDEIRDFFIAKKQEAIGIRKKIIEMLIYVRDHKKELLKISFENYLENEIGITKGYFYEQVQAYELCQKYHLPQYFSEVDYKILVMIARIKDTQTQEKLILKAPELTREMVKKVSQTDKKNSQIGSSELTVSMKENKQLILTFKNDLSDQEKKEILDFLGKRYSISLLED